MFFETVDFSYEERVDRTPRVTLWRDRLWNDHGFRTRYAVIFHVSSSEVLELGEIKILQRGRHRTELPGEFEALPGEYISLGQSEEYYRRLEALGATGDEILRALRDITHPALARFEASSMGEGVELSLLRFSGARKVFAQRTQRSATGTLSFNYRFAFKAFDNKHEVSFHFDPRSPLGRINVMVGENASGKTSVLGRLAFALSGTPADQEISPSDLRLAPILAVSFSPFDNFRRPDRSNPLYDYIGLRRHEPSRAGDDELQSLDLDIRGAFERLDLRAEEIREQQRVDGWREALKTCRVDPDITESGRLSSRMLHLSAGQKFAVFVFTNLVAKLESRAMVLFDEPELHTHPRMLSGMMRALSRLLHRHDSYAIVATHSPIVLQEVPARSLRVFTRRDGLVHVSEYARDHEEESFGAPLDQIVRYAFDLARTDRNFVHHIQESAEQGPEALAALEALLTQERSMTTQALLRRFRRGET